MSNSDKKLLIVFWVACGLVLLGSGYVYFVRGAQNEMELYTLVQAPVTVIGFLVVLMAGFLIWRPKDD